MRNEQFSVRGWLAQFAALIAVLAALGMIVVVFSRPTTAEDDDEYTRLVCTGGLIAGRPGPMDAERCKDFNQWKR
jgi:hypothetical protein